MEEKGDDEEGVNGKLSEGQEKEEEEKKSSVQRRITAFDPCASFVL